MNQNTLDRTALGICLILLAITLPALRFIYLEHDELVSLRYEFHELQEKQTSMEAVSYLEKRPDLVSSMVSDIEQIKQSHCTVGLFSKDFILQTVFQSELESIRAESESYDLQVRNRALSLKAEEEQLISMRGQISASEYNVEMEQINKKRANLDSFSKLKDHEIQKKQDVVEKKFNERLDYASGVLYRRNGDLIVLISINSGVSLAPYVGSRKMVTFVDVSDQLLSLF